MNTKDRCEQISFPSKVDAWIVVVLLGSFVYALIGALKQVQADTSLGAALLAFAPIILFCAVLAVLGVPTRYELTPNALIVRSGLLRYRVSYDDIRDIEPTRSPLAAPAWSLDRLRIGKRGGYLLVSPTDKAAFIEALRARAPQMRVPPHA